MKRTYTLLGIILLVLVLALAAYKLYPVNQAQPAGVSPTSAVTYSCEAGKTFTASFTDSSVALVLSDGRALTLPQAVSGSGIRYEANGIALIGKGSNAFIEEGGTQTYLNCIVNAAPSATATSTASTGDTIPFTDQGHTFSLSYPSSLTAMGGDMSYTESWMNNATNLGLILAKFNLPKTFQAKTNFSEANLIVGTSADPVAVSKCLSDTAGLATSKTSVVINGTTFTKIVSSDAGAGNLYQTTSYHTKRNDQCYVVEYTIHSTNIGNYSPDQGIREYDHAKVTAELERVIQSFKFL